jgi:hypothetical protein
MPHLSTSTDPSSLTVGLIAGCHPTHAGVDTGQHFHEVLTSVLWDQRSVALHWEIAAGRGPLTWLMSLLQARGAECVIVQPRIHDIISSAGAVGGRGSKAVRRLFGVPEEDTRPSQSTSDDSAASDLPLPLTERAATAANLLLGLVTGTAANAVAAQVDGHSSAADAAAAWGLPLIVCGPVLSDAWWMPGRALLRRTSAALRTVARPRDLPYADLRLGWRPDAHLMPDGIHLSAAGHRFVAMRLAAEAAEPLAQLALTKERT